MKMFSPFRPNILKFAVSFPVACFVSFYRVMNEVYLMILVMAGLSQLLGAVIQSIIKLGFV